jgi:acylphosphatase
MMRQIADKSVALKGSFFKDVRGGDSMIGMRVVFQGEVQGVGFRATVRKHAVRLGLVGTVRNLPDGSVELVVEGNPLTIDSLLAYLKGPQGPGRVSKMLIEDISPESHYDDFNILA